MLSNKEISTLDGNCYSLSAQSVPSLYIQFEVPRKVEQL